MREMMHVAEMEEDLMRERDEMERDNQQRDDRHDRRMRLFELFMRERAHIRD